MKTQAKYTFGNLSLDADTHTQAHTNTHREATPQLVRLGIKIFAYLMLTWDRIFNYFDHIYKKYKRKDQLLIIYFEFSGIADGSKLCMFF